MIRYNDPKWIGQKFGMLTVVSPVRVTTSCGQMWYWNAKCECGKETTVRPIQAISGKTRSCGCLRHKYIPWNKSHAESHTRLHNIWCSINNRCNPDHKHTERYGKRGITICDEWKDYENFANWARSNGYQDDLTIERIDVNGNYCPENCTWLPIEKQARNRRTTRWVEYNGRKMSLAEACEIANMPYKQVFWRMARAGWPFEKAISVPMGETLGKHEYVHNCVVCGNEFTCNSPRGKYCSHECYVKYRSLNRKNSA